MCGCPICGSPEVNEATGLLNVRAFKVVCERGLHWSECLVCKEADGNGWFALEDDAIVIDPDRIAVIEARGHEVERIAA